jgi:small GTP-binding protein
LEIRLLVPESIRSRGAAAVANFLTELEKGAERLEARIIILGEKGAGKTCLARRLIKLDAPMTTDAESTAGVDTSPWKFQENNIAHIWDFAGHTITHAAHKFFLSERSLYILVCNGRTEGENHLEYWLNHIQNYGKNAHVFILINKRDQHTPPEIPINSLKEKYSIAGVYTFSIETDKADLENFRKTVTDFITNNPSYNQKIPATNYKVKAELENLFKEGQERIEYSKFEEIAEEYGIKNKTELLKNLHVLGICLWYETMQGFDTLVLNPEWISGGVYKIINWVHEQKNHEIALADFRKVFEKDVRYPENQDAFLFKLMIQYELAFETKKGGRLIIPYLLHEDRPAELPAFDIGESLMLRYKAEQSLPPDTISRFIVRRNEDIRKAEDGKYKVWRRGVVLKNEKGDIALVREDDRTISILVKGSGKTAYLDELRKTMNEIFESYKSDKPEMQYKVILPEELIIRPENPFFLSAHRLFNLSQENKYHYDDESRQDIDIRPTVIGYAIRQDTLLERRPINNLVINIINPPQKESSDESVKKENESLKNILIAKEIKKWQRTAYFLIFPIILILLFVYFQFFHNTWEYNYVKKLIDLIDKDPSDTKKNLMMYVNAALSVSLLILMIKSCWNRLFSTNKKREKEKSIRENMHF